VHAWLEIDVFRRRRQLTARRSRYRMELKRPRNYLNRNEDALTLQRHILRCPAPEDHYEYGSLFL
jgi:hypothetical protein